MKATVAVLAILLFVSSAVADKPKTVNEAVQILKTKWLQPKDPIGPDKSRYQTSAVPSIHLSGRRVNHAPAC
jgi:hypothetical protein